MAWDPQKPKIDPVDPPVDPILAHFVGKKANFGVKKRVFLKNVFLLKSILFRFPVGLGPSKTQISTPRPPELPEQKIQNINPPKYTHFHIS